MKKAWGLTALLFALDRATKLWADISLQQVGTMPALPGVFSLAYARNTGAAFSMLSGNNAALLAFNAVMIAVVAYFAVSRRHFAALTRFGLMLIAGGGLGNVIDRLFYGYVIDFISLSFMRFAIFNVADIMVTCGAVLAVAGVLFVKREGCA